MLVTEATEVKSAKVDKNSLKYRKKPTVFPQRVNLIPN